MTFKSSMPVYLLVESVAAQTAAEHLCRAKSEAILKSGLGLLFPGDADADTSGQIETKVKIDHSALGRELLRSIADNASPLVVSAALKAAGAPHDRAGFNAVIDKALKLICSESQQFGGEFAVPSYKTAEPAPVQTEPAEAPASAEACEAVRDAAE